MKNKSMVDVVCKDCGSEKNTLSGSNSWVALKKATASSPAVKVLKQRFVCSDCGGFNWRHLDGSLIRKNYTDEEIRKLVKLTKNKIAEKALKNKNGGY